MIRAPLAVVIPVLDEAQVLPELVARVRRAATTAHPDARVLIVDDASTDATPELSASLSDDVVRFLRLPRRSGQLGATLAGLAACDADVCVVLDGDLQDPPETLPDLVAALTASPRLLAAFAVKHARDDGRWRELASDLHGAVLRRLLERAPPPGAGSYCAFRRDVARAVLAVERPTGNLAALVAAAAAGDVAVVTYRKAARRAGSSKVGLVGLAREAIGTWTTALRASRAIGPAARERAASVVPPSARAPRVAVLGGGYLGVATTAGQLLRGADVTLAESDDARRATLSDGLLPVHEPGVGELLREGLARGHLSVCGSLGSGPFDLVAVCVATPVHADGREDDTQLRAALVAARAAVDRGAALVLRSTVAPGTTERLVAELDLPAARVFTTPEFLRQGTALADVLHPARVVIGTAAEPSDEHLARVQRAFEVPGAPTYLVGHTEAELIKCGANAFLATKLAFANDLALLCDVQGADAGQVLAAIAADPRIGLGHFAAGFGFGGSCLPKDLRSLAARADLVGAPLPLVRAALASSARHGLALGERVRRACDGDLSGRTIALLGLSFKAGTDDTRGSPALDLAALLLAAGASVIGYDPVAVLGADAPLLRRVASLDEALRAADLAVLTTDWPDIVDALRSRDAGARPIVVDGRRAL